MSAPIQNNIKQTDMTYRKVLEIIESIKHDNKDAVISFFISGKKVAHACLFNGDTVTVEPEYVRVVNNYGTQWLDLEKIEIIEI